MFKNYLKIAGRNLWKDKFYACINLAGLSIATAVFLLIFNYVNFERSYEQFHKNAANICRVTLDLFKGAEYITTDCETYPPLGPALKDKMPEVKEFVRMQDLGPTELKLNDKVLMAEKNYAADPSLFTVFSYELLYGDKKTALAEPMNIVLTEKIAKKFFGVTNALGKTLQMYGQQVLVAGIVKDIPGNTHLKFDLLIPFNTLQRFGADLNSWGGNNNYLYLQMKPLYNLVAFNEKLKQFSRQRLKNEVITAEPIKDIHLYSHKTFEPEVNGDARIVLFLAIASFLIILVGTANYVNLATARSLEKVKEAGIRKLLGASRRSLIALFLMESILINSISLVFSLLFIKAGLPLYTSLTGNVTDTDIFSSGNFWIATGCIFIVNCLFSGLYPAFFLASVKSKTVTSRTSTGLQKYGWLRKTIVVGQFAIALCVISASAIIYQQLAFVRHQDLGMNIEQVLVIKAPDTDTSPSAQKKHSFKQRLQNIKGIEDVSYAMSIPGLPLQFLNTNTGIKRLEETEAKGDNYYLYGIDADYLSLMKISLVAGRNFVPGYLNKDELIINEEAARRLGFRSAAEAIGKKIIVNSGNVQTGTVIGVIKNYHQQSLKSNILPMIHWFQESGGGFYMAKIFPGDVHKTISAVKDVWQSNFSGHVFDYYFLNDMFNQQYKADVIFGKIVNVFSIFTLLITCLGLFGLSAYSTTRRTKEIGIRKVLGASVNSIVILFSGEFMKLILLAIVLSIPASWMIMNRWLEGFAYRINIRWWLFIIIGVGAMSIALCTIAIQAIKAALANPVKSLRTE